MTKSRINLRQIEVPRKKILFRSKPSISFIWFLEFSSVYLRKFSNFSSENNDNCQSLTRVWENLSNFCSNWRDQNVNSAEKFRKISKVFYDLGHFQTAQNILDWLHLSDLFSVWSFFSTRVSSVRDPASL